KEPRVRLRLRHFLKESCEVAPHSQTCTRPVHNPACSRLQNANPAFRHSQFNVICPQCGGKTATEHADKHHSVDACQRCGVEMNEPEITPFFGMHACQLQ